MNAIEEHRLSDGGEEAWAAAQAYRLYTLDRAPMCQDIKGHGDWQKVQGNVAHLVDVGYGHLRVACVWEGKRVDLYWEIPALAVPRRRHYPLQMVMPDTRLPPAVIPKVTPPALPLAHPALNRRQSHSRLRNAVGRVVPEPQAVPHVKTQEACWC